MTLGFSTHWGAKMGSLSGAPTYFIDKIWEGLKSDSCLGERAIFEVQKYSNEYLKKFGEHWDDFSHDAWTYDQLHSCRTLPKLHTIRKGNRWKEGMKIHMVVHNRTKDRFQFAPVIKCTGVQDIKIRHEIWETQNVKIPMKNIYIDGFTCGHKVAHDIARNDGFDSIYDFFQFFNEDFEGQIIHWTGLKY